jgi:excinuclease ABC subunit C
VARRGETARRNALRPAPTTDEQVQVMRDTVRAGAADRPGVYRMMSPGGEVIYVGKSKRVRTRLLSYFRGAYPEHKGARILREADRIAWDYTPNEFDALVQELRLIKQFRPRFNVAMKRDAHNYAFIKVTRGPAPKLSVVRSAGSDDGGAYYGPFLGAMRVGEALRELNDALGLRDCALDTTIRFSDQVEIFTPPLRTPGCIRHEIQKCLGPCIGACSERAYAARVALARAFFEGTNDGPLTTLAGEMQQASDRLEYERAARLRDKIQRLEMLREQFDRLRFAVETLSFVYSISGYDGEDRLYLIRRGCVRAICAAPRTPVEQDALHDLATSIFSEPGRSATAVPAHEVDELMLVSSWFRRHPDELGRAKGWPLARTG